MKCLCCGKMISDHASEQEKVVCWHKKCIKRFFGVEKMPYIDIDEKTLSQFVENNTKKGNTVTGVQKKMSLQLTEDDATQRLTLVDYPSGYILKPQTPEYPCLPEAEHLAMQMAELVGIRTVSHALIRSTTGELYYITKRVDRTRNHKIAMEDFCQLSERLTEDKYKGSYERCAQIINHYSSKKGLDLTELFLRIVFSFIIGNSDMHLKNFSLIEEKPYSGEYTISPAYDLLTVNVVNPKDTEQMALTVNGKKRNIHRKDFLLLGKQCGLEQKVVENMIKKVLSKKDQLIEACHASYLPSGLQEKCIELIEKRCCVMCHGDVSV